MQAWLRCGFSRGTLLSHREALGIASALQRTGLGLTYASLRKITRSGRGAPVCTRLPLRTGDVRFTASGKAERSTESEPVSSPSNWVRCPCNGGLQWLKVLALGIPTILHL